MDSGADVNAPEEAATDVAATEAAADSGSASASIAQLSAGAPDPASAVLSDSADCAVAGSAPPAPEAGGSVIWEIAFPVRREAEPTVFTMQDFISKLTDCMQNTRGDKRLRWVLSKAPPDAVLPQFMWESVGRRGMHLDQDSWTRVLTSDRVRCLGAVTAIPRLVKAKPDLFRQLLAQEAGAPEFPCVVAQALIAGIVSRSHDAVSACLEAGAAPGLRVPAAFNRHSTALHAAAETKDLPVAAALLVSMSAAAAGVPPRTFSPLLAAAQPALPASAAAVDAARPGLPMPPVVGLARSRSSGSGRAVPLPSAAAVAAGGVPVPLAAIVAAAADAAAATGGGGGDDESSGSAAAASAAAGGTSTPTALLCQAAYAFATGQVDQAERTLDAASAAARTVGAACVTGVFDAALDAPDAGGGIGALDDDGNTCLHRACELGHVAMAALLTLHGAPLAATNEDFMMAVSCRGAGSRRISLAVFDRMLTNLRLDCPLHLHITLTLTLGYSVAFSNANTNTIMRLLPLLQQLPLFLDSSCMMRHPYASASSCSLG